MPLPKEQSYTIKDIYDLPDGQRAELTAQIPHSWGIWGGLLWRDFIKQKEHLQRQMFFLIIIYVFLHQMITFSFHSFLIPILFHTVY